MQVVTQAPSLPALLDEVADAARDEEADEALDAEEELFDAAAEDAEDEEDAADEAEEAAAEEALLPSGPTEHQAESAKLLPPLNSDFEQLKLPLRVA